MYIGLAMMIGRNEPAGNPEFFKLMLEDGFDLLQEDGSLIFI